MSDDKATFLVMASYDAPVKWTRPYFVRAKSLREAYIEVLTQNEEFQHPRVSFEAFVVSPGMLPDLKRLLKAWWMLAQKNAGNVHPNNEADFEAAWDELGYDPEGT